MAGPHNAMQCNGQCVSGHHCRSKYTLVHLAARWRFGRNFFPRLTETEFGKFQHTHTYRPHLLLAACSEQKAHVPLLPNIATSQTLARVYTALLSTSSVALALRLHSRILARLCSEEEAHRHIVCVPFVPNKRASRTTPCQPHIKHTQRISSSWTRSPYHLLLVLMITTRTTRITRIGHG